MPDALESTSDAPLGEALTGAAMRGDREAICRLWEQHRRWVAAVLLAHKPAFEDLDDLLQEVAVTFVSKVNTLREESNLRAWLRTIAVNAARAAGRSGKYRPKAPLPQELPEPGRRSASAGAAAQVAMNESTQAMLERVRRLPEAYREPLLLRAVQGMRSKQIGDILGIPPATVDTRIARARRMLRHPEEVQADQARTAGAVADGALIGAGDRHDR